MTINYQKIAAVDPDQDNLNLYEFSLREFGYTVKTFIDPHNLLNYLNNNPKQVGLIIIEYLLSDMTGSVLADKVYSIDPKIKIAIVTGYLKITNNKRELEVITKPVTLTRMLRLVRKYIN